MSSVFLCTQAENNVFKSSQGYLSPVVDSTTAEMQTSFGSTLGLWSSACPLLLSSVMQQII